MYLVLPDRLLERFADLIKTRPTEAFVAMVREHAIAYVQGKEPPAEIATAVMNAADDMLAGRTPTIRAGDYIALMNYARANNIV
jgi:hypothetical protein